MKHIPDISIIIPFLNEGCEVEYTLESIISHTNNIHVEIILINDGSNDGYDYENSIKKYNDILYYENKKTVGVASCRNSGIKVSKAPYFMLLDAHMRFYSHNTIETILSELRRDQRQILCCQTKRLSIINGECRPEPNAEISYGAYIQFHGDKGGLYAIWNKEENDKNSEIMDIPCILGAAYAGNKEYWNYLLGLEGLQSYGSDEAYLSLKVWQEGGHCKLLKNIEVGHVYRKSFPYTFNPADYVYNKIFISDLLLPKPLRNKVLLQLKQNFPSQYKEAYMTCFSKKYYISELKKYYNKIFTRNFTFFYQLNQFNLNQLTSNKKNEILKQIALYIKKNLSENSIKKNVNNMIWPILFCFIYSNENKAYKKIAQQYLNFLLNENGKRLPFDNSKELCIIGWGLEFLFQNNYCQRSEAISIKIDQKIALYDFSNPNEEIYWIFYYIISRLKSDHFNTTLFTEDFLNKSVHVAINMITESNEYFESALDYIACLEKKAYDDEPVKMENLLYLFDLNYLASNNEPIDLNEHVWYGLKLILNYDL